jgi:hypothetical protein
MISDARPAPAAILTEEFPIGAPWTQMMKLSIFDPTCIDEIRFSPGRHRAEPTGTVRAPARDEVYLLHYKYLGLETTHARHAQQRTGLREFDHQQGWGHKYRWSLDQLRNDWEQVKLEAIDVHRFRNSGAPYPFAAWWSDYRLVN